MRTRVLAAAALLLNSFGLALLVCSLVAAPSQHLLADDGDPGGTATVVCLAKNGCNSGCKLGSGGGCDPSAGYSGCAAQGCSLCPCRGCEYSGQGWFCNCQCQSGDNGCTSTVACKAN